MAAVRGSRMKRVGALILAVACWFVTACGGRAAADAPRPIAKPAHQSVTVKALKPLPTSGVDPKATAFWNAKDGLLAGTLKNAGKGVGFIALSTDGGLTWHLAYQGGTSVNHLHLVGQHEALATETKSGGTSQILMSSTSGRSFDVLSAASGLHNAQASGHRMWAVKETNHAIALETKSSGHWHMLGSGCAKPLVLSAYSLVTPKLAFTLCVEGTPGHGLQSDVRISTDGGKTFSAQGLRGVVLQGTPSGLSFRSGQLGWLWEKKGPMYSTRNGGRSWVDLQVTPGSTYVIDATRISKTAGFALFQTAAGIRFEQTEDGGQFWAILHTFKKA